MQKEGGNRANRMSRPPGENLAHRSGVRCERRSGVVGVHEQRGYERTHDSDDDSNCGKRSLSSKTWRRGQSPSCLPARCIGTSRISPRSRTPRRRLVRCPWPPTWRARSGSLRWVPRGRRYTVAAWSPRSAPWWTSPPPSICWPSAMASRRQVPSPGCTRIPGTEAFLVLEGQLSQQTPHGVNVVEAGKTLAGGAAEVPMEVTSSGGEELHWLIMFVLDANKPFASDATFGSEAPAVKPRPRRRSSRRVVVSPAPQHGVQTDQADR